MKNRKPRYVNSRKDIALKEFDLASLDDEKCDLCKRCKFNFSYFDNTQVGQDFSDLSETQLHSLINSLIEFSRSSLGYWETQGPRFVMYYKFPLRTEFKHPKHVPHQVCWGRFRLGNKLRLVGFTVPSSLHGKPHNETKELYDKNTFYIVFLDRNHLFWKTEPK